jgi:hypothetical protein
MLKEIAEKSVMESSADGESETRFQKRMHSLEKIYLGNSYNGSVGFLYIVGMNKSWGSA